jgi:hypothetical protein
MHWNTCLNFLTATISAAKASEEIQEENKTADQCLGAGIDI